MRILIQRVKEASVSIKGSVFSNIGQGLLLLVGIEDSDNQEDIDWLCKKASNLRIFDDENGVMNLSIKDIQGEMLIVSQTGHPTSKRPNLTSAFRFTKPSAKAWKRILKRK